MPTENQGASTSLSRALDDEHGKLTDDGIIGGKTFRRILKLIINALPIGGKGTRVYETPHGRAIDATATGAAAETFPFMGGIGEEGVTVRHGYVGTVMPTIDGTPLDDVPPPELTVGSGAQKVYLVMNFTLQKSDDETRVLGGDLDDVQVESGGTLPDDDGAAGIFYRVLFTANDGVPAPNDIRFSLDWLICDDGSAGGVAELKLGVAG